MSSDVDSPSDDNVAESKIILENDSTDAVEAIVKKYQGIMNQEKAECPDSGDNNRDDPDY